MRILRVAALACLTIAICGGVFGRNVKTDYDRSFDFGRLRSFTFQSRDSFGENNIVDNRIREALTRDLESRGFRYEPDGHADFVVAYYAHERPQVETEVVGYGMPLRWRWGWGPTFWTRYYTQGSVMVDFVDTGSNQLVWRGRVTDTVTGLEQSQKQIDKGVNELVKHFEKDTEKKH